MSSIVSGTHLSGNNPHGTVESSETSQDERERRSSRDSVAFETEPYVPVRDTDRSKFEMIFAKYREIAVQAIRKLSGQPEFIEHLPNNEQESIKYRTALAYLHEIKQRADDDARNMALEAVQQGYLSRVEASSMLGVHQGTVARWVKEDSGRLSSESKDNID